MFGLFGSKKKSLLDGGILQGATDNHSHILYGVDDGVKTVEESMKILHFYEEAGLQTLWLTPHVMEDVPNTTEGLKDRFAQLQAAYAGPIRLKLAAEYMIDTLFVERLRDKDLLLHGGDRVLMETSTWSPPIDLWEIIEEALHAGYRPLIAHPERYRYMRMKDYERLKNMGCLLQLNLPSIVGVYGEETRAKAETLLEKGFYCMFGSDCHRSRALDSQVHAPVFKPDVLRKLEALKQGAE